MIETMIHEEEWVVGPSWVDLEKKLHELAGENNIQIQITGRELSLINQRVNYRISGLRQSLNTFNKRLLSEGHVKFIGIN